MEQFGLHVQALPRVRVILEEQLRREHKLGLILLLILNQEQAQVNLLLLHNLHGRVVAVIPNQVQLAERVAVLTADRVLQVGVQALIADQAAPVAAALTADQVAAAQVVVAVPTADQAAAAQVEAQAEVILVGVQAEVAQAVPRVQGVQVEAQGAVLLLHADNKFRKYSVAGEFASRD
jgi:hypothetical protein